MSNKPKRRPSHANRIHEAAEQRQRRTGLIIGVLVGAVVLALVVALLATRSEEVTTTPTGSGGTVVQGKLNAGDVTVTGTPLPEFTGEPDRADGLTAPTLSGVQFDDSPITLPEAGKPAVVMFIAHWCPHCQAEVPRLVEQLEQDGLPSDVNLYAVATGNSPDRPNYPPSEWLQEEGWTVQTMVDDADGTAASAYGLSGFPFFVVLDSSGAVVQRYSGELAEGQFDELLAAARSGTAGDTGDAGPSSPR